jgi:SAM-dependent methyltransferase
VDFLPEHEPDVLADVLELPFGDGTASYALAQDVLEHLPRTSTNAALEEWSRVLSNDGILELRVPSLFHAVELMKSNPSVSFHETLIQNLYGTQAYTGDIHLTSFTDLTLVHYLHQSGFSGVTVEIKDDWMFDIRAFKNPSLAKTATVLSKGIYGEEQNKNEKWRWIASNEQVKIINNAESSKMIQISFRPLHPTDQDAKIVINAGGHTFTPALNKDFNLSLEISTGCTEINFSVDAIQVSENSTRDLRLQLRNFAMSVIS